MLHHFTSTIKSLATSSTEVFADLPNFQVNGTTLPADVIVSVGEGSKPDLVILNREERIIALLELTCSLPKSADNAHQRKLKTYTQLAIDIEEKGYKVFLMPFEVISSGHITRTNKTNVKNTLRQFRIKVKNSLYIDMAKIALLCTMSVFHAYQVKEWVSPPLLSP